MNSPHRVLVAAPEPRLVDNGVCLFSERAARIPSPASLAGEREGEGTVVWGWRGICACTS